MIKASVSYIQATFALASVLFGSLPAASEELRVNGVTLDYVVLGSGPPLYLLHGGMESRDSFANQIPILTDHFTVVALDSREQGRSGSSSEQISYDLMAADVLALANELGHDRFSIVGSSDGGITGLTIAITNPQMIENLVLLGASFNVDAYPDEMLAFLRNYEWDGSTEPNTYPGMMIDHYLTGHENLEDFGELLKEMSLMWTTTPNYTEADLRKITARTLVINGDREDMVIEHAVALYRGIPTAQLYIVPEGSHYSLQRQPERINRALLSFLIGE